ncbi:MAG: peptidase protein, leader peptidase (prepilin peptidase) [Candidatus Berkelbacteria bacterium]|nr:peptidase protein, leader peptidase (prepilin peptidase) [Candidatus Berkelbacteria bacterium]
MVVIFGLAVGSFLNVIILRFDELKTIWKVRSHCLKCKKEIRWYDLIPFLSYFVLGAKCRYCKKPISYQYPIVEGLTALLFACIYYHYGLTWQALLLAIIASILVVISIYDMLHYEVPDILSYLGILFALGFVFVKLYSASSLNWESIIPYGYAILAAGGFLGFLVIISKEKWMGAGDILLGILMGILLGMPNVLTALFVAFISGSLIGLILIAGRKKTIKDAVPFGPFLVLGTLVALFWGEKLINYYFGIF